MRLKQLALTNYRNFVHTNVSLGEGFTVFSGHNGAGKTNLLESLYLLSTVRSFRASQLVPLVRRGQQLAKVDAVVYDPAIGIDSTFTVTISCNEGKARRRLEVDGKFVRSASSFYGQVSTILFTPEDLAVLRGSPSGRRQFLDRALFARDRAHIEDIRIYEKLLRSRNRVLKDGLKSPSSQTDELLDTYDAGLAETGAQIWARRMQFIDEITPGFHHAFQQIIDGPGGSEQSDALDASVTYKSRVENTSDDNRVEVLLGALRERRPEDKRRGTTSLGPHLDDIEVLFEGAPAHEHASQGQTRALMLALKISELRAATAANGHPPVLLLDDVSSELDPRRSAQLFETLAQEVKQCVLTTTSSEYIKLGANTPRLDLAVKNGVVEIYENAIL